jgi:hypothetical protein
MKTILGHSGACYETTDCCYWHGRAGRSTIACDWEDKPTWYALLAVALGDRLMKGNSFDGVLEKINWRKL